MADPPPAFDTPARKAELRRVLRDRRRAFVAGLGGERTPLEQALGLRLLEHVEGAEVVAFTRSVGAEIDAAPALAAVHEAGRVTALPVSLPGEGRLAFHAWRPGKPLRPGPHGIEEPTEREPVRPDLIVLPLVGFDRRGGRLGQGGGYYDRTLVAHPQARRIGLAWSCQEISAVPTDTHDLPLDAVLTEREWIAMPKAASR